MAGFKFKRSSGTFLLIVFIMNITSSITFLTEGASASINGTNGWCNGTIGDCFFGVEEDEIEEFQRYSAGGRWLLQSNNHISYDVLQQPRVCNAAQYSNCIVQVNAQNRPCTEYNRCKRA